jgi:hypothetical protein
MSRAAVQEQQNILILTSKAWSSLSDMFAVIHAFDFAVNFVGSVLMVLKRRGFWNFSITNRCSFSVPSESINSKS